MAESMNWQTLAVGDTVFADVGAAVGAGKAGRRCCVVEVDGDDVGLKILKGFDDFGIVYVAGKDCYKVRG